MSLRRQLFGNGEFKVRGIMTALQAQRGGSTDHCELLELQCIADETCPRGAWAELVEDYSEIFVSADASLSNHESETRASVGITVCWLIGPNSDFVRVMKFGECFEEDRLGLAADVAEARALHAALGILSLYENHNRISTKMTFVSDRAPMLSNVVFLLKVGSMEAGKEKRHLQRKLTNLKPKGFFEVFCVAKSILGLARQRPCVDIICVCHTSIKDIESSKRKKQRHPWKSGGDPDQTARHFYDYALVHKSMPFDPDLVNMDDLQQEIQSGIDNLPLHLAVGQKISIEVVSIGHSFMQDFEGRDASPCGQGYG
jgi:hypothetical protein